MARRFAMNPDYLQSVPAKSRTKAREASKGMQVSPDAPKPANAPLVSRKHWARVIGAATLASLLSFALFASPGENPAYKSRVFPEQKTIAQGLKYRHNPIHALTSETNGRKRNADDQRKW